MDEVIRYEKKRGVPDCKFNQPDWNKEKNSTVQHGIRTKDTFHNKAPRVMMNEMIAKSEKKKGVPPLGTHSPNFGLVEDRIRGLPKSDIPLHLLTADEEYLAQQSPGSKYKPEKADHLTRPKPLIAKIYEKRKNPDEHKLKKVSGPEPGSYDSPRAFYKNQDFNRLTHSKILSGSLSRKNFFDEKASRIKYVPPPGHYKQDPKVFDKLSQSPRAIRIGRH